MDDIKLFAKNEKELETPIQTVRLYSQDIGMEFSLEKCAMLIMKNSKRHMTEGVELPKSSRHQNAWRKGYLQILWYIGSWHYQASGNERKILKSVSQMNQKITRSKTL